MLEICRLICPARNICGAICSMRSTSAEAKISCLDPRQTSKNQFAVFEVEFADQLAVHITRPKPVLPKLPLSKVAFINDRGSLPDSADRHGEMCHGEGVSHDGLHADRRVQLWIKDGGYGIHTIDTKAQNTSPRPTEQIAEQ